MWEEIPKQRDISQHGNLNRVLINGLLLISKAVISMYKAMNYNMQMPYSMPS